MATHPRVREPTNSMFLYFVALWALATTVFSLEEYQFLGSCDEHSVPYKITVNEQGRPEVHCASPSCLGDEYIPSDRHHSHVHRRVHNVTCAGFRDDSCNAPDQWIAGFMEVNDGVRLTFKTKCCTYSGLVNAKPVKTVVLQADEEFTGGAYVRNEGVGGFDIIKEVKRRVQRGGIVKFEVTVVRMPCQLDEADDYDQDLHLGSRRTGYRGGQKSYRGLGPRRPLYRSPFRPFGFRRRNLLDDYYYDYEEDFYQPRRRFELRGARPRSRVQNAQNVLWPIAYNSPKQRAFGAENEETDPYEPPKEIQVEASEGSATPSMVLVVQQPPESPKSHIAMPAYPAQNTVDTYSSKSEVGPAAPVQTASMDMYMQGQQQPVMQMQRPVATEMESYQQANVAVQQQPMTVGVGVTYGPMVPPVPDIQVPGQQTAAAGQGYAVANVQEIPPTQQIYQQTYQQQGYQQTYQPSTYQTGTCGGGCTSCCGGMNNLFAQMRCFSGEDEVQTTAGVKKMKDLQVGDMVMSFEESSITYSPVVMFLHKLDDHEGEFLRITTAHNQTMEVTDLHLIYSSSCRPGADSRLVHAKDVEVGQCLTVLNGKGGILYSPIKSIEKVTRKGIYAPLTFTGEIFVNDVLASCHSNLGVRLLQQSFFTTYKIVSNYLRQLTSWDLFSYGKELPTGVTMVTAAMDLFLPHSYL